MRHAPALRRAGQMSSVLATLVPVFLLILLGAAITRLGLLGRSGWQGVEALTYHVLIPPFLIVTLARADLSGAMVATGSLVLSGAVLVMAGICLVLRRPFERMLGVGGPAFTSIFQGACRWNSFAALAIAGTLYGTVGATVAAVAVIAMVPLLNILCVLVLVRYAAGTPLRAPALLHTIATNPFIWGSAIGITLNVSSLPIPGIVDATLDMLARATLPLSLVMVGGGLDLTKLGRIDTPLAIACALKLVVMPVIVLAAAVPLGFTGAALGALVLCAAVPTASASYLLARRMGGDAEFMARIITAQTLASLVSLPIWLILVR